MASQDLLRFVFFFLLNQILKIVSSFFSDKCVDATVEEVHHFIHGKYGFAKAYPNIFGMKPTLVSTLQNAMDKAR